MKYQNIKNYTDTKFRRVTGVNTKTFSEMLCKLKEAYSQKHKNRGRHSKLTIEDMLLATLEYFKEYRTYEDIAASYGLTKANVCRTIRWVEEVLIKSGLFNLPGKKSLSGINVQYEVIIVDTTETPIQRPSKGQKPYYSGKKNDIH